MNLFIICLFVVITAPLATIALALIKIGSEEIFRYAEQKKEWYWSFMYPIKLDNIITNNGLIKSFRWAIQIFSRHFPMDSKS